MSSCRLPFNALVALSLLVAVECRSDEPDRAAKPTADSMLGKESGQVRDDNGLKMKLVWCPPGIFTMQNSQVIEVPATTARQVANDSDDDVVEESVPQPRVTTNVTQVRVFLRNGYWFGRYEVTQSEWKELMNTEPWKRQTYTKEGPDFPATWVNWEDATEFCRALTERERHAGRLPEDWAYTLPTEAQWERACRARTESSFSFGDDPLRLGDYGWFFGNSRIADEKHARRVGQKKPNPWGLYDMHGNVFEWCRDVFAEKLPGGRDPEVTESGSRRVIRGGGCWSDIERCRSGNRYWRSPASRDFDLGFRVALSPSGNK